MIVRKLVRKIIPKKILLPSGIKLYMQEHPPMDTRRLPNGLWKLK